MLLLFRGGRAGLAEIEWLLPRKGRLVATTREVFFGRGSRIGTGGERGRKQGIGGASLVVCSGWW